MNNNAVGIDMVEQISNRLHKELKKSISAEQYRWLETGLTKIENSNDLINECLNLSAVTLRNLGQVMLSPDAEAFSLSEEYALPIRYWTVTEAARSLLILKTVLIDIDTVPTLIKNYYEQGDENEIGAITRLLSVFDNAEKFKFFTREVSRTNNKMLFSKLAQYNPYPAVHYTEHEFNQLILKALFMGIGIDSVIGLCRRANPELSKMCEEYIDERIAAERSLPVDIWLAMEPFVSPAGEEMMIEHLSSPIPEHRYYAVKAMLQSQPLSRRRREIVERHLLIETNDEIRALILSTSTTILR